MNFLTVILTLAVTAFVATLVIKKMNPLFTFLISGIVILLAWTAVTQQSILGQNSMGNIYFDVFGFVAQQFETNVAGIVAIIMTVTGYAAYMKHIHASEKLAYYAVKPLRTINNPYLVLSGIFVLGVILKVVITSQSALALLLIATVFPILTALKINSLTAASVLTLICFDYGPNDGSTIFASKVAKIPVVQLFTNYQIYFIIAITIILAIVIPFYYRYMDKRDVSNGTLEAAKAEELQNPDCPGYYAIFPALPLLIVLILSFVKGLTPDVVACNFIGLILVFIIELIRRHDFKSVSSDMKVVFQAMGTAFANVVSIIICASIFATGINKMGGITILANAISNIKGASILTIIMMSLITFAAAIIMGSGAASWFAFGPLVPNIAAKLSVNQLSMILPMELGSAIGRAISPVAGATIAISGYANQDVVKVVKRTAPLLGLAMLITIVVAFVMFVF